MVNLEPNSASVGLRDLTHQFDDILGGVNSDRENRNGDSVRVHPDQTRLPSILGEDSTDGNSDRGTNTITRNAQNIVFSGREGNGDNLIGGLNQDHIVNDRNSNSIPSLVVTGEISISRHNQHLIETTSSANSGLEIRDNHNLFDRTFIYV